MEVTQQFFSYNSSTPSLVEICLREQTYTIRHIRAHFTLVVRKMSAGRKTFLKTRARIERIKLAIHKEIVT
jgi:hypothetical protein